MKKKVNLQPGPFTALPFSRVTVLDTETTGLYPFGVKEDGSPTGDPQGHDRLCSVTMLKLWKRPSGWKRVWEYTWLVDPGRTIPEAAAVVNNFAWAQYGNVPKGRINLFGKRPFSLIADEVRSLLDDEPIVCHNAAFDIAMLDAEFKRSGFSKLRNPAVCTKKAYSDIQGQGRPNTYVKGTNLNSLCDRLEIDRSSRKVHTSRLDTNLTADCFAILDKAGWLVAEDPATFPHNNRIYRVHHG